MRKILLGIVIALVVVFGFRYYEQQKEDRNQVIADTALIEKQLKNVGKLIVTEGTYAQVFSYEDSKKFYFDIFSSTKKALVVVNAEASISYDLSKITSEILTESKTVRITSIPEPELKINPNIEYYDVSQDYLNQFEAKDHNIIKKRVEVSLRDKIEASDLRQNAENRLISELQKIYILTSSMGWVLEYNSQTIDKPETLEVLR